MKNVNAMLDVLFEGVQLRRWNGICKAEEYVETAKQGLNAAIAYILAKMYEEKTGEKVNYQALIELSICRMVYKVIFTDINPRISYRVLKGLKVESTEYALGKAKELGFSKSFCNMFAKYLDIKDSNNFIELQIFKAASKLATYWEFNQIKQSGGQSYLLKKTEREIKERIEQTKSCSVVEDFLLDSGVNDFIDLYANTAFIERWARFEMSPKISDLSHMYMTAVITYLFMCQGELSSKRAIEGFYAGLFHDTLEILTGDLPYGLKKNIPGLKSKLTTIELEEYDEVIRPLLPLFLESELKRYLLSDISERDRKIMKAADNLCAYVEAITSVVTGITQDYFIELIERDALEYGEYEIGKIKVKSAYKHFYQKYLAHKSK